MANRMRFVTEDDLCLLKEVLALNPFENTENWKMVHENVVLGANKQFTMRAVKDHLDLLLKLFIKEDKSNLKKSGTEEQYEEKKQLLQKIVDLKNEFRAARQQRGLSQDNESRRKGMQQREQAARTLATAAGSSSYRRTTETELTYYIEEKPEAIFSQENNSLVDIEINEATNSDLAYAVVVEENSQNTVEGNEQPVELDRPNTHRPVRQRTKKMPLRNATLAFLENRQNREQQLKTKELELEEKRLLLEERKVALQEARLELEKQEQLHRLETEAHERAHQQSVHLQQTKLLETMLSQIIKH